MLPKWIINESLTLFMKTEDKTLLANFLTRNIFDPPLYDELYDQICKIDTPAVKDAIMNYHGKELAKGLSETMLDGKTAEALYENIGQITNKAIYTACIHNDESSLMKFLNDCFYDKEIMQSFFNRVHEVERVAYNLVGEMSTDSDKLRKRSCEKMLDSYTELHRGSIELLLSNAWFERLGNEMASAQLLNEMIVVAREAVMPEDLMAFLKSKINDDIAAELMCDEIQEIHRFSGELAEKMRYERLSRRRAAKLLCGKYSNLSSGTIDILMGDALFASR
jgi:hypothetical protein